MLRQSDGYLSGQQLCDHFQVSRTAVWKAINQLKEEGYEIEAVRNKGYRIVDIPDRITADAIKSCLETKWMAKNLEYYDEIDSTNNRAKALGEAGASFYIAGHPPFIILKDRWPAISILEQISILFS